MENIVKFPGLNLSDISAGLRRLADNIDEGQYPDADAVVVVMPVEGGFPMVFGFGSDDRLDGVSVIGHLEMAKAWFITHLTERA